MYTVLLVDDEPTILETLSSTICWQQFGVNTLLKALDGYQALEIMQNQKVDLLITDIEMPNLDGLTLLKKARAAFPEVHCILLTAYGEFQYAQIALQYGVENYLLKPINKTELEETIEKALNNIYAKRKNSHILFRENILLRWVTGTISSEELSERSEFLNLNLYLLEYCILCVTAKHPRSLSAYCKICAERLSSSYEIYQFKNERNQYISIIGGSKIIPNQLLSCYAEEAARLEISSVIVLSLGNTVKNADSLPESYQTACRLLKSADISSPDMLVLTEEQDQVQETDKLLQNISNIFPLQDEITIMKSFQDITTKLFLLAEANTVAYSYSLLAQTLCRYFAQEFPNQNAIQEQLLNRVRLLPTSPDRDTFITAVTELLKYSHFLFCYYFKQLSPIIQSAIHFIHEHYAEGISIQEFCLKSKMSAPYLGYLFKKETGFFFHNYLLQYRICCSIPLLLDTDLKVSDIANKVGFSNSGYYITCFKKQTGLSPIKYRTKQL